MRSDGGEIGRPRRPQLEQENKGGKGAGSCVCSPQARWCAWLGGRWTKTAMAMVKLVWRPGSKTRKKRLLQGLRPHVVDDGDVVDDGEEEGHARRGRDRRRARRRRGRAPRCVRDGDGAIDLVAKPTRKRRRRTRGTLGEAWDKELGLKKARVSGATSRALVLAVPMATARGEGKGGCGEQGRR